MFKCEYVGDGVTITPDPEAQIAALQAQAKILATQNEGAQEELKAVLKKVEDAKRDLQTLVDEAARRTAARKAVDDQIAQLSAQAAAIQKQISETTGFDFSKKNELQRQLDEINKSIAEAQQKKAALDAETAKIQQGIVLVAQQKDAAEKAFRAFVVDTDAKKKSANDALTALQNLQTVAQNSAKDFQSRAEQAKKVAADAQSRVDSLTKQIETLTQRSSGLTKEVNVLTKQKDDLFAQKSRIQKDYDDLQVKKLAAERDVASGQKKVADTAARGYGAAASASADISRGAGRGFMGLSSGDYRYAREALNGIGSVLGQGAKIMDDGRVIAGEGWVDAFRQSVRNDYGIPKPPVVDYRGSQSNAYNTTGTAMATDTFASRDAIVGAKLAGRLGKIHKSYGFRGLSGLNGVDMSVIQGPLDCCVFGQNCASGPYSGTEGIKKAKIVGVQRHFIEIFGRAPTDDEIMYYGAMYYCAHPANFGEDNDEMRGIMLQIRNQIADAQKQLEAVKKNKKLKPPDRGLLSTTPKRESFPGGPAAFEEAFASRSGLLDSIFNSPALKNVIDKITSAAETQAQKLIENATKPPAGGSGGDSGGGKTPAPSTDAGGDASGGDSGGGMQLDQGLPVYAYVGIGVAALLLTGLVVYKISQR